MYFLRKPQILGAFGALMFGGRAVQGIELDLTDTSKIWHPSNAGTYLDQYSQITDLISSVFRLNKASSKHSSLRHDDLLHRERDRTTRRVITKPILLVGSRGSVWTDDRILVLYG